MGGRCSPREHFVDHTRSWQRIIRSRLDVSPAHLTWLAHTWPCIQDHLRAEFSAPVLPLPVNLSPAFLCVHWFVTLVHQWLAERHTPSSCLHARSRNTWVPCKYLGGPRGSKSLLLGDEMSCLYHSYLTPVGNSRNYPFRAALGWNLLQNAAQTHMLTSASIIFKNEIVHDR